MIFYKVKNKASGQISVLTETAKNLIERHESNKDKYEILEECDQQGRSFDYNNFLNKVNESKSIELGPTEEKESFDTGRNARNGPITETTANNSNENDKAVDSNTKPKRVKLGKGK